MTSENANIGRRLSQSLFGLSKFIVAGALGAAIVLVWGGSLIGSRDKSVLTLGADKVSDTRVYEISSIIRAVKAELTKAQRTMVASGEAAMFQVNTFDLELNFVIREATGSSIQGGAPQFLVVSETNEYSRERVQKIQLHMSILPDQVKSGSISTDIKSGAFEVINLDK